MAHDPQRQLDAVHMHFWLGALNLQADRVLAKPPGPESAWHAEIDATLFAIALRNVIRAAEHCRPHAPDVVEVSLVKFHERVPHAAEVRNVIEHFDDYERGEGHLQRQGRVDQILRWYSFDGRTYTLNISGKFALDVREALEASGEMVGAVMEAVVGE